MQFSANGEYILVSTSECLAAGVKNITRTTARCLCGGPDPLKRAREYMYTLNSESPWYIGADVDGGHGHEIHFVVRASDWPSPRSLADAKPVVNKQVPDWPLACPKCHRGASAVLLFMGYDCKHGCYK